MNFCGIYWPTNQSPSYHLYMCHTEYHTYTCSTGTQNTTPTTQNTIPTTQNTTPTTQNTIPTTQNTTPTTQNTTPTHVPQGHRIPHLHMFHRDTEYHAYHSLGSRPSPFTHTYISKRIRYTDSGSRTGKAWA